jgi:hypothetical protein
MNPLFRRPAVAILGAILTGLLVLGWGRTGHRYFNIRATVHLPASMQSFTQDSTFFGDHASDADDRKGNDPTEGPKHYIDLENIPASGQLTRNLDSLIAVMGASVVSSNGTLPWATADAYDSLVAQLARQEWSAARLTASDLGHYVADGHNPLHLTVNYNGQLTGNSGIHSRYESGMINAFVDQLVVEPRTAVYIADPFGLALAYCVAGNGLVDSIMAADSYAKAVSGWTGSFDPPAEYTVALWERSRELTLERMQRGTEALASLWYSAWVDAGLITLGAPTSDNRSLPQDVTLSQNYPNPFNPATTISVALSEESLITLKVFDLAGREVAVLVDGTRPAGRWNVTFEGGQLPSGVYVYQLLSRPTTGAGSEVSTRSRRMVLLR